MNKSKALILGGCTLWPIVYMFLFMGTMFSQFIMMELGISLPQEKCLQ